MRRDHAPVLHHGGRDGPHVVEGLLGLTGAQELDVVQDSVVSLKEEEKIKSCT